MNAKILKILENLKFGIIGQLGILINTGCKKYPPPFHISECQVGPTRGDHNPGKLDLKNGRWTKIPTTIFFFMNLFRLA